MKKSLQAASAFLILFAASAATAHPPSEIKASFDGKSRIFRVTVEHDSKKPEEHFIKSIQIKINGKEAIKQIYLKQIDSRQRTASYLLEDVKPGDEITVMSECNVFGKKTQVLTI